MPRIITEQSFFQYLKCPAWVYLDAHEPHLRPARHAMLDLLQDGGLVKGKRDWLISEREDVAEITAEDREEAYYQTLEFMRAGRQTIVGAVLMDKHWIGSPDLLEKVEGRSKLGDFYYVAADVKHHRNLYDEHMFQGCFYAELLERIQGVKPVQGYVVNPDNEVMPYIIEDFEADYRLTLDEIEAIVAGRRPSHFLTSGCKQSPWFQWCREDAVECDDISQLNRIWREEAERMREAGIGTVSELAAIPPEKLEMRVPDLSPDRLATMREQAVAMRDHEIVVREPVVMPEEGKAQLYFDIESDPLRDLHYLFGVLAVEGGKEEYHAFVARTPEEEGKAWGEFAAFVESYMDAPIYHYGDYERNVCLRLADRYETPPLAKEALERNLFDLIAVMRPAVLFPLPFYSLKDIANELGFSWRDDDASGANSVVWIEEWFEKGSEAALKRVLEYNEDDVRATKVVADWLRKNAAA